MNKPLVSVIVVNWNGIRHIGDCLDSLIVQDWPNFEIIVVDNGSSDDSYEFLKSHYGSRLILIKNTQNLGFGVANNQGIMIAKGEYIALLNNDVNVVPGWIRTLVQGIEDDKKIGMCISKLYLLRSKGDNIIDNIGHLLYPDGLNRGKGRLESDVGQYDMLREPALFPSGAACLYRYAMLEEISLFDEDFFAYGDDTDIGLRARWAGWRVIFCPQAIGYHLYSASSGEYSSLKAFLVERNRVWIAIKYLPISMLLVSPYYTLKRFFFQAYGALVGKGASGEFVKRESAWQLFFILLKAYISAIKQFPKMWRKRKMINQLKRLTDKQMKALLRQYTISAKEIALKK